MQAQQGNKYITNFSPSQYKASDQNWGSVQDKDGVMFFANLNGVLIYNGIKWETVILPNEENVTSIDIDENNKIFIGAENEFGYLYQNTKGKYCYKSLVDSILKTKNEFSIIWATYCIDDVVYFCANEKIYLFENNKLISFSPEKDRFHTFFKIGTHLFVREYEVGFKVIENNQLHFVLGSELFSDKKVYAMLPLSEEDFIVASRNGGIYRMNYNAKHPSQSTFEKTNSTLDKWLNDYDLYCGKKIENNTFALGSLKNGVILIDSNLKIKSFINSNKGLQDDAIKNITIDANKNIWLSLNKGITLFENNTPISYFGKTDGISGVVENSIIFLNSIYIATDKGLLKYDSIKEKFISTDISSPCYVLSKTDKDLFITSNDGTYSFNGKSFHLINEELSYSCAFNKSNNNLYVGTENGLLILNYKGDIIKRFDDLGSIRSIAFDKNNNCALGTSKNGVYVLTTNGNLKKLGLKNGLLKIVETTVFNFNGNIYIAMDGGFFAMNIDFTKIDKAKGFEKKEGWVVETPTQINNQIWFQSSLKDNVKESIKEISVFDYYNNKFNLIFTYLNRIQNSNIKHFLHNEKYIYISTNQGLYLYELNKYILPKKFNIVLTKISLGIDTIENITQDFNPTLITDYNHNELQIIPSATSFYESQKIEFSYYLEGKETEFRNYETKQVIEYNNLHEGDYIFHIKAKDILHNETKELTFKFSVNPPWYRSILAYIAYILLSIALIALIIKFYTKRLKQKNIELENTITERTKTIVSQNHELEHKNKEITDSINYAQRIQKSLLASNALLSKNLKNYFVFFQPKDIVSGDFYWGAELSNNQFALVTADSTGHGVPGAIMSMLNISCLNESIEAHKHIEPKDILNSTRQKIIKHLANDGSESGGKDGMDCSIICFNFEKNKFTYSAANNPIWVVRNNELIELKADKMPVGKHDKDNQSFTQHEFEFQKNDIIYTLTDGMPDQFGGPKGKKYMYKQLKEFLLTICNLPMEEQKNSLEKSFQNWKNNLEQVDDVLLIGVKI